MSRKWYKLVLRQMKPMHIGIFNYGVLSETRIFIPGWTMWGAFVNQYGQYKGGKEEHFEEGQQIFETITCFYPKLESENKILFPQFQKRDFYLGDYSENEFRAKFTDVYTSTSIQPSSLTAKDESLHEIEIVLPKSKMIRERENLSWVGLLGIDEEKAEKVKGFFEEGLEVIIGGDTRYGLGNMKLEKLCEATAEDLEEWSVTESGEWKFSSEPLKNYFAITDGLFKQFDESERIFKIGEIEHVAIQLDFSEATPKIEKSKVCIIPGSVLREKFFQDCHYKLKQGIFQAN